MTKIAGILSASYSGSTILTMALGALEGVFPAGETSQLRATEPDLFFCAACKGDCTVWTREKRVALAKADDWWTELRSVLAQFDWVISSKLHKHPEQLDHLILMWRDPRGWTSSAIKHEGFDVDHAIPQWVSLYRHLLAVTDAFPNVTYVDFDYFCEDQLSEFRRIVAGLGIDTRTIDRLDLTSDHMIGGNVAAAGGESTDDHATYFGDRIRRDYRWQWLLSEAENRQIIEDEGVQEVLTELRNRHIRQVAMWLTIDRTGLSGRSLAQSIESARNGEAGFENVLESPLNGIFEVEPVPGQTPVRMFTANDCVVTRALVLRGPGGFESTMMQAWNQFCPDVDTVLDVGAYTGLYALFSVTANPRIRALAFEPSSVTYSRILVNIKLNGQVPRIVPINAGVSHERGKLDLNHPFGVYVMASGESFLSERIPNPTFTSECDVVTLDDMIFDETALASRRVVPVEMVAGRILIKIDAEGFESNVLQGAGRLIDERSPTIFFGYALPAAGTFEDIRGHLPGYALFYIDEGAAGFVPFEAGSSPRIGNWLAIPPAETARLNWVNEHTTSV